MLRMFAFSGCAKIRSSRRVGHQETLENFGVFVTEFLSPDAFIPAENKDDLPLFMLAEFSGAGVRRCAQNVLCLHGLVLDIDKGSVEELRAILDRVGEYGHIVYTTFSHSPQQPKLRVIVKTDRPVDIAEWSSFWQRAGQHLGASQCIDSKCADAAHLYYVPGGDFQKYLVFGEDGPGLPVDEILKIELPPGVADLSLFVPEPVDEADRGEITQGLKDLWDAKLQHLCDEIRKRPYPGQIYDLKSHRVYGLARGVPHVLSETRLRNMVRLALVSRAKGDDRYLSKAFTQVDQAIEQGKAKPWYPLKVDEVGAHPFTELGLARRLLDRHAPSICWEPSWLKWLIWSGKYWDAEAGSALVQERMIDTVMSIPEEADAHYHEYTVAQEALEQAGKDPNITQGERGRIEFQYEAAKKAIEEIHAFAIKTQTKAKIAAGINLASSDPRALVSHTQFNRHPWLLNCNNGTVDLRTGMLLPHNPQQYLTRITPWDYDPTARCPRFDKFLLECHPPSVAEFLWRLIGYSLVGVTSEQIMVINVGDGANGKSTFMNVLLETLSQSPRGYAFAANSENLLTTRGGGRHETWRMDMHGRRVVAATEVEEGRSFAESLIKELTGSDTITGRRMREDAWSYIPEFTLWLSCNSLPNVRGTDEGIWRRIITIPWTVSFRRRADRALASRLAQEIPGILARAVREARTWQEQGLVLPPEVVEATAEYRKEQDPLEPFLEQFCMAGEGTTPRGLLWAAYLEYTTTAKTTVFHQKKSFYTAMEKKFKVHRTKDGERSFVGVRLLTAKERIERSPRFQLAQAEVKVN